MLVSNKKTGVTWGGDTVSSEDDDVDLPGGQGRQIGVKGASDGPVADLLLRLVCFGVLVVGFFLLRLRHQCRTSSNFLGKPVEASFTSTEGKDVGIVINDCCWFFLNTLQDFFAFPHA